MNQLTNSAERAYRAAQMYYLQAETMDSIARQLGVSRPTVSRLLASARDSGIVRIEVRKPGMSSQLEAEFANTFALRTTIVNVREGSTEISRLQKVAAVAAEQLVRMVGPGSILGTAWGTTMSEVAAALPVTPLPGVTIVQLNGASDPLNSGPNASEVLSQMGAAFSARTISFPVPAFFDHAETRQALWKERSISQVLQLAAQANTVVFGVGALDSALPSQVYARGHLSAADRLALHQEQIVGDVCTVLLRADGSWRDVSLNARATGPTPEQLWKIPQRLCVVASPSKAPALLAAIRAGVMTDCVLDQATAAATLKLAGLRRRRS